jgi:hypothetical protein
VAIGANHIFGGDPDQTIVRRDGRTETGASRHSNRMDAPLRRRPSLMIS